MAYIMSVQANRYNCKKGWQCGLSKRCQEKKYFGECIACCDLKVIFPVGLCVVSS